MRTSAPARTGVAAFAALSLTACVSVRVERGVDDAGLDFQKAYTEIARIDRRQDRGTERPHRLCVLVHDAAKGELVHVSVPMWLVDAGLDLGEHASRHEHGGSVADRYDLEWRAVRDLGRYGPGLLVSVEEEKARVLIWLK